MNHPFTTTFLRRAAFAAVLSGALTASLAWAAAPLKTIEECLESGTRLVTLPGIASGSFSASECSGCKSVRVSFDSRTRYFIGKQQVPYAKFREIAEKGQTRLYVYYRPETRTLTRLRLVAAGPTQ